MSSSNDNFIYCKKKINWAIINNYRNNNFIVAIFNYCYNFLFTKEKNSGIIKEKQIL